MAHPCYHCRGVAHEPAPSCTHECYHCGKAGHEHPPLCPNAPCALCREDPWRHKDSCPVARLERLAEETYQLRSMIDPPPTPLTERVLEYIFDKIRSGLARVRKTRRMLTGRCTSCNGKGEMSAGSLGHYACTNCGGSGEDYYGGF